MVGVPSARVRFDWRSGALGGRLGAAHTVELPFVFDCLAEPTLGGPDGLLGPQAPPQSLATEMHQASGSVRDHRRPRVGAGIPPHVRRVSRSAAPHAGSQRVR